MTRKRIRRDRARDSPLVFVPGSSCSRFRRTTSASRAAKPKSPCSALSNISVCVLALREWTVLDKEGCVWTQDAHFALRRNKNNDEHLDYSSSVCVTPLHVARSFQDALAIADLRACLTVSTCSVFFGPSQHQDGSRDRCMDGLGVIPKTS